MEILNPFWQTVQEMQGLYAVAAEWREGMGDWFETMSHLFRLCPDPAKFFPCPKKCGCAHEVDICPGGEILAFRRSDSDRCEILSLTPEDIALWELNVPKLARAIGIAFSLASKFEEFAPNTYEIGTWSADAVPVFLTIQCDESQFRHVVASLVLRCHRKFILLGPTAAHMDAISQGYLASVEAEFFPLETTLNITDHGTFQPKRLPGEIFSHFAPTTKEQMDENEAIRVFAILQALNSMRPPTVITVMELYCKKGT